VAFSVIEEDGIMRYLLFCLAAVVSLLILWVPLAEAGPVTVQVTGRVTGSNFVTIGVASPVTGFYSYDDAMPNSYPDDSHGLYHPATFSLSFVDGSTISSSEAEIWVNNNSGGIGTVDEYSVNFQLHDDPSPNILTGAFAGLDVDFGGRLYRNNPTGVAWDSVALPDPESVLSLLPNDGSGLSLIAVPSYDLSTYNLDFEVTDLSVVPAIPAPGAALLTTLALGLMSANWRLRKRRTV
jgi:hypothetical protein